MEEVELPDCLEKVDNFLQQHSPIQDIRYKHENTILHKMCQLEMSVDIVKALLSHNASVHINSRNIRDETPLHRLLQQPHPSQEVIRLLLEQKASLTTEDHLLNTPFLTAVKEAQMESIETLRSFALEHYQIDLIHESSSKKRTPLHRACSDGRTRVIEYLLANKVDINALDSNHESPVFAAVIDGHLDALECLLEQKNIDLTIQSDKKKLTLLHYASGKESPFFAKYILASVTDVQKKRELLGLRNVERKTALFSAVFYNRPEIVKMLLASNAGPNCRDRNGQTPLFEAVLRNNVEMVEILLDSVAEVNLQDRCNMTTLAYAQKMRNKQIQQLLLDGGALMDIGTSQEFSTSTEQTTNNSSLLQKRKFEKLGETGDIEFKNINVLEQIGSGAFGRVHRGEWLGTVVAIKFFSHNDPKKRAMFSQEIELLKSLNHPHIVNCYGDCLSEAGEQCMVMEFLPYDLSNVITTKDFTLPEIITIAKSIASGMVYLHNKQIIHRDLKPSNILLSANMEPKIADFGVSRTCDGIATMTSIGTPLYMAPEMIKDKKYGDSVDVYSFGMILLQLFTKRKLFYELGNRDSLNTLFQVINHNLRPNIPTTVPPDIATLIQKCWDVCPSERPSFVEISQFLESHVEPTFDTNSTALNNDMGETIILDGGTLPVG